jgi:enoyl-CoA hydratase
MSPQITTAREGRVVIATLTNPPHALMSTQMVIELDQLVRDWDSDNSIGAVVLTGGDPRGFLAHFDVATLLQAARNSPPLSPAQARAAYRLVGAISRLPGASRILEGGPASGLLELKRFHELMLRMGRSGVAYVAAINGSTSGGGCELALACDFRLMEMGPHEIGQPEVLIGIPPGGGGTQRLTRLLGTGRALEIALSGEPVTSSRAAEIGLITQAVPAGELLNEAIAMASRLGRRSKPAVQAIKRAVRDGGSLPLKQGLAIERGQLLWALGTPEAIALMEAYVAFTDRTGVLPAFDPEARTCLIDGTFA